MRMSGEFQRVQAAVGENRLRILKDHWLPLAAFVALTLPLAFVEPTPPLPANSNLIPTAKTAPLPAPASTPAPLPQAAATAKTAPKHTAEAHKSSRRILISIPDRKLALLEDGKVKKIYPVAVGADVSPSPAGEFHIAQKIVAPNYSHNGKVIAAGKGNPLGSRWMGLDIEHYGIHGTNMPKSIGHAASHGCIRMGKHDVEELFTLASVGDVVEIHDQPTEEMAQIFGVGVGTGSATGTEIGSSQPAKSNELAQAEQPKLAGGGQ